MPLARIKRFGNQFASCGIPVRPPENLVGSPGIKRRCPKLVPGQVIELPDDHTLFDQECIEIVRRVGHDEIKRPWVFATADDAMRANPNKARLSHDQIQNGLLMAEGAIEHADLNREKTRKQNAKRQPAEEFDGEEIELEPEEKVSQRSRNRHAADIYEDAEPVNDDEDGEAPEAEDDEPAPRSSGRRKRDAPGTPEIEDDEPAPKSRRRRAAERRR